MTTAEGWTSEKLREKFLSFFESRGHKILPSSSVVPKDDPTLLFTNSGMVQFKGIFMGESPTYKKVCTAQRCIRAGGKHNDLDDVGKDNYHHTFFEMLGNWSFGDYFKAEAIEYAYTFLINELGLNKDRIYVTIYEEMDPESRALWRRYLDDSRILSASQKDNFWEMGEYGPCGPCTEIHYDRIGGRDASSLVNKDDPNVIEIWNIVFMEYNRTPEGLFPLKKKNIDTGIGMERLLSILSNVDSNYKIDSFVKITNFIESNCKYTFRDTNSLNDVAFRVLADHSRTIAVCLNDKVAFSSVGVGYVLRRILRRAVRYAHEVLCIKPGILSQIVKCAAETLKLSISVKDVDYEESLFLNTLKKGILQFNKIVETKGMLSGEDVFLLYDTYGFPKDLTELLAKEKGIAISFEGFEHCQEVAKKLSKGKNEKVPQIVDLQKTDDSFKYVSNNIAASLLAVVKNGVIISKESALVSDLLSLIFDKTCFYGEKGGQIGDTGMIIFLKDGEVCGSFEVTGTKIISGYVHHMGKLVSGRITNIANLCYNEEERQKIRANHSTAHILYFYLRKLLDSADDNTQNSTTQQGSLVDAEKCRFDFNGPKLTIGQLCKLEKDINGFVKSSAKRSIRILSKDDALKEGIPLEDEDYSQGVRVIEFSNGTIAVLDACSGTHVETTSEIEIVKIMSEGSIKAGIRRIVAFTREAARAAEAKAHELMDKALSGEVFVIEGQVPLIDKGKIIDQIKKNQEVQSKALEVFTETVAAKLKEKALNHRLENINNERILMWEVDINPFGKQVAKVIASLGKVLVSEKVCGVLYAFSNTMLYSAVYTKNLDLLSERLTESFGKGRFKITKSLITGTIKASEKSKFMKIIEEHK